MAASKLSKLFRSAASRGNFAAKTSPTDSILKRILKTPSSSDVAVETTRRFSSWGGGPKAMLHGVAIDNDGDRWVIKKLEETTLDPVVKMCVQNLWADVTLCDGNRKEEVLLLLGNILEKVSSVSVASIFKSLGRLSLESIAKKLIVHLQSNGTGAEDISNFIYNYASSMSESLLKVEDIALTFKNLHEEFAVNPSRVPYEKLIRISCDVHKVQVALDIVDWMLEADLTTSIETFHSILNATLKSCEYDLVHRIYSAILSHKLKPNAETFEIMITLCVEMEDFISAYMMMKRMWEMNLVPRLYMYKAVMEGYRQEKEILFLKPGGVDDKPDSQTFSCIVNNGSSVEDINKVVLDTKRIPIKGSSNEIKGRLLTAISNGLMSDALNIYEELKQVKGANLEPSAIISLIEHIQSEGELDRLLELLEQLKNTNFWGVGCCRVVSYCNQHGHGRVAADLLRQTFLRIERKYERHWALQKKTNWRWTEPDH